MQPAKLLTFFILAGASSAFFLQTEVSLGDERVKPIEDLRLPIEYYENGRIKTVFQAKLANVPSQGAIEASNIRVEFYSENGMLDGFITAGSCRYSRDKGVAWSESHINFTRGGIVVTGTGFEWNANKESVKIFKNAKVVIKKRSMNEKSAPDSVGDSNTVITSGQLIFDYKRSLAVFEEDVVVMDPRLRIRSDKLNVRFDRSHALKSVTALGNVRLRREDHTSTCRKAIYIVKTGKILLVGDAQLNRGMDFLTGHLITLWVDEDRVTCEQGRLILFADG